VYQTFFEQELLIRPVVILVFLWESWSVCCLQWDFIENYFEDFLAVQSIHAVYGCWIFKGGVMWLCRWIFATRMLSRLFSIYTGMLFNFVMYEVLLCGTWKWMWNSECLNMSDHWKSNRFWPGYSILAESMLWFILRVWRPLERAVQNLCLITSTIFWELWISWMLWTLENARRSECTRMLPLFFEFLWLLILLYTLNNGICDSGSSRGIIIWGILIVCLTFDKLSVFIRDIWWKRTILVQLNSSFICRLVQILRIKFGIFGH